tara:strand:+ start:348 stop:680 length:333 start_codon:yes stop_codon:yes gene_type:complete
MVHVDYYKPGTDAKIDQIVANLRQVFDPEIFTNIYDLGLIYNIKLIGKNACYIRMTLTSAFCPVADSLIEQVRQAGSLVFGDKVELEVVFDPPWTPDMIPEHTKLEMNLF